MSKIKNRITRAVHVYDNGGKTFDRYTIVFTKSEVIDGVSYFYYVGSSDSPTHPQGFWQHGESKGSPIDKPDGKHLGKRIPFHQLPDICQKLVNDELNTVL